MIPDRSQTNTTKSLLSPTIQEFMDASGNYVFRDSLKNPISTHESAHLVFSLCEQLIERGGTHSNGQIYDEVHLELCGPEPLEPEELRLFMKWFIEAHRRILRQRAEVAMQKPPVDWAEINTFKSGANTSLYLVDNYPHVVLARLDKLDELLQSQPDTAFIYELWDFAECRDEEIAAITEQITKRVVRQRLVAAAHVMAGDPQ